MIEGPQKPLRTLKCDVHQKLGRVLVMLQVYESSLKSLLALSNIEVVQTNDGFRHNLDDNKEAMRNKTLGQLVKQYTSGNMLLAKVDEPEQVTESDSDDVPDDGKIRLKISYSTEVDADEFDRVKGCLVELVELRNNLVHHFLERFDLQSEASFIEASDYLDESFSRVKAQYEELKQRLMAMDNARKLYAEMMNSPLFKNVYAYQGIDPEGREHFWPFTPVVAALREAEQQLAAEGWTKLNDAINYIRKHYPEDFPKRYRFKRWDQLINSTHLFDLGDAVFPDGQKFVVYRSNQPEQALTENIE